MLSREQINDVGGGDDDDDIDYGDQYSTIPCEDKPNRKRNMNRKRNKHRKMAILMKTWMRKVILDMRRNNSII